MTQYLIEVIFSLIKSKQAEDMENVLYWFEKGSYKEDENTKGQLREYLKNHPLNFLNAEQKQREIFQKLCSLLNVKGTGEAS